MTQTVFATNRLVLVAPNDTEWLLDLSQPELDGIAFDRPFAIAEPQTVPAGIYGRQALESMSLYDYFAPSFAYAQNVRVVLAWVARGEASAGIVYTTDALAEDDVRVVSVFPEDSHDPIEYWAGIVKGRESAAAAAFIALLSTTDVQAKLVAQGFSLPKSDLLDAPNQSPYPF